MKSRALRLFLLLVFVGLVGGTAYTVWTEERQGGTTAAAARGFDEQVRTATRALLDLRNAQSGYVAAGQGEDFWATRVDALLASSRNALSSLQAGARTAVAEDAIEAAASAFDDFGQMDRRARNYARNGQRLLASDLVFSDGLDKIDVALAALDRARHAEHAAGEAAVFGHRRAQALALAGAAAAGLLLMALLAPVPRVAAVPALSAAPPVAPAKVADAADALPLNSPPRAADSPVAPPAPEPVAAVPVAPPPAGAPPPEVDLPGIASLCMDLARVMDMQTLPSALERAARLLHASGIVIWIADPDRRELAPVIAHGYPAQLIARMGTIACDDENVTAAAFRTALVQIVTPQDGANGAIAAPLVTPTGTVGVMAAEVLPDGASDDAARAAATIVAAQLSTLVGPPTARSASGAAGAAGA